MPGRTRKGSAAPTSRRSEAAARSSTNGVLDPTADAVAALEGKGVDWLREAWRQRFGRPAPQIQSADILRRLFAWKIQEDIFGGLDPETVAALKRARSLIAKGRSPAPSKAGSTLRAGTVLVREWRGVTHRVLVLDSGFEHEGKRFSSLSEVARAISGTRWSGPRFFGLEQHPAPPTRTASP